ncbi:MAG: nicotinate-nucleotide--dimethylbenzimidazole phosphoribosyltransferase [Bacillaceae bacterium]|nr:nicotinate-nucleotide--dimethylbenzimidazole phosphoribosyltransferase [Bacillaceae bacterium]
MANQFGAKLNVVDIGVAANFNYEQLIDRKIRYGTANFYQEDAMTRKEAIQAIEVGIEVTEQLINRGIRCLVLSNVGMANAACLDIIYSIVTGNSVLGNDYVDLIDKRRVNAEDPVDILAKVGGLEIAGMIGAILKAAERRIPILVDGPASLIAVLLAYKLSKHSISYILIGQKNLDPISVGVTELLEQRPLVDLGVQLFDGTGALLAYPLIHSALTILIDTISKENF